MKNNKLFDFELNSDNLLLIGLIIIVYVMLMCHLTKDTFEKLTNPIDDTSRLSLQRDSLMNIYDIKDNMTKSETTYSPHILKFKDYYDMIVSPLN